MNHRPFEDWLLAEEPLSSEMKADLQDHLKSCSSCSALAEVNMALHTKRLAAPAPGFGSRFQSRLAMQRTAQRRRNIGGSIILLVVALGLFAWLVLPYLQWASRSPMDMFITWVTTLSLFLSSLLAYGRAGSVILRVASGFIPLYLWVAVFTLTGFVGLLWVASVRKFAPQYEGVKQ